MCGIVGVVRPGRAPVMEDEITRMASAIVHRGPDEGGSHCAPGVGLGIRRLRIIDLVTGSQPIANEDGSIWTVLNGEIYNFQALREELTGLGHTFRTQTDTECLVHAYEAFGTDCVSKLRGMFAFALWDASAERLLLARDRLGKKPLVYAELGRELVFASELQGLLRHPGIPRDLDFGALGDYLAYGYVPAPATIFRAVRKLPPGHRLIWEQGRTRVERYWQLPYLPKLRVTEAQALEQLEARLSEAVRLRLIADVPIGALLSGGVDSSVVVALMARHSPGTIKTFAIGFDHAAYDELPHARRVAERFGTDHHEFTVKPDAAAVLPILVRHYGEPYADSSAVPTYYVNQIARRHVTVALNGDGGDEMFAGYDRYRAMWMAELIRQARIFTPFLPAAAAMMGGMTILPERIRTRGWRFLAAASLSAAARHAKWVSTHPTDDREDMLHPAVARAVAAQRSHIVERTYEANTGLSMTDRQLATDVATYLPFDLLVKMDIASMANSLETRSPLLDHEVAEFAARLPSDLKLRRGVEQKYVLRQLARRLGVPSENLDRKKMGFSIPAKEWLRGPLREFSADVLFSERARGRGLLQAESVRKLWDVHQAGTLDRTFPIWVLLMLELWCREFLDRVPEGSAAGCQAN
jgi:asparagine synthase (glutamine-hydrolysing)